MPIMPLIIMGFIIIGFIIIGFIIMELIGMPIMPFIIIGFIGMLIMLLVGICIAGIIVRSSLYRRARCGRGSLCSLGRAVTLTDLIPESYRGIYQACNPNQYGRCTSNPFERIFVQPNKTNVQGIGGTIRYRGCGRERCTAKCVPDSATRGEELASQMSGRSVWTSSAPRMPRPAQTALTALPLVWNALRDRRVVVVAARELDEDARLGTDGPGVVARRQQHHIVF